MSAVRDQLIVWSQAAAIDVAQILRPDELAAWIVANRFRLADLESQSSGAADALRLVLHKQWDAMPAAEAVTHA